MGGQRIPRGWKELRRVQESNVTFWVKSNIGLQIISQVEKKNKTN